MKYECFFCLTGQMVYTVRQRCGRQLALEAPTDADVVSTVPESATPAALGYAQQVSNNDALLVHAVPLQNITFCLFLSLAFRMSRCCVRTATWAERSFNQTLAYVSLELPRSLGRWLITLLANEWCLSMIPLWGATPSPLLLNCWRKQVHQR